MCRKHGLRALEQRQCGGPRSNVNQIDAHQRIRSLLRPRESCHVKVNRRIDIGQAFVPNAQGNGFAQLRVWIGRLPREASQRLGEMADVLSRTAGDLQHNASFG